MSPKFFFHKMRKVASFLKIRTRKATGNAMKDESKFYLDVKGETLNQRQPQAGQEKVLRESGGQDISAI